MDTLDVHTTLQDYAHTKRYYIHDNDIQSHLDMMNKVKGYQVIGTATKQSPLCNDTLTLYMVEVPNEVTSASVDINAHDSVDTPSCTILYHGGSYCSLVHASAELLCEYYASEGDEHVRQSVSSMYDMLLSKNIVSDTMNTRFHVKEYHMQVLYGVLRMPMSACRKTCFLLAWRTIDEIFSVRKGA